MGDPTISLFTFWTALVLIFWMYDCVWKYMAKARRMWWNRSQITSHTSLTNDINSFYSNVWPNSPFTFKPVVYKLPIQTSSWIDIRRRIITIIRSTVSLKSSCGTGSNMALFELEAPFCFHSDRSSTRDCTHSEGLIGFLALQKLFQVCVPQQFRNFVSPK
jgi:hypothetical protein